MIRPVILCGGSGKRLWPVSRSHRPKPFLPLFGDRSLFQQAIDRVDHPLFGEPLVVCGEEHEDTAAEQATSCRIAVEPASRNTAPAIALAANLSHADDILLVCPADHIITDNVAFLQAVSQAVLLAKKGLLVCLGIAPTRAETGYGYITQGEALGPGFKVAHFWEKPDAARAAAFIAQPDVVWNAGIFIFRAGAFLREFHKFCPVTAELVKRSVEYGDEADGCFYPLAEPYREIASESVDRAVFEKTENAAVIRADMKWSDVGTWSSLKDALPSDPSGNVVEGAARVIGCRNVLIQSDGPHVTAVGLENVIIVVDRDEILVMPRDAAHRLHDYLEGDHS